MKTEWTIDRLRAELNRRSSRTGGWEAVVNGLPPEAVLALLEPRKDGGSWNLLIMEAARTRVFREGIEAERWWT